ncbi:MAG: oxygen-independent coproporphyrinogen III oxidase [Mizugakiibacter sp.]|uniref:oxygen-independent coproporphyrinogen III oxidase n=1 Tax=Mizugakiibacter sp. TaxID=1972610 RepID=UPI0031C89433|nr:oxygen-independent coproporphyrinogen III oxidase [Xanthomonadaceae bacterium]
MSTSTAIAAPTFDPDLIARYDTLGPRYTSYPTAPQFRPGFGEAELRAHARASNEDPIPRRLSLYVHVPFCMSPCFYCGCTRIITRDKSKAGVYLSRLYREIELTAALFDRDRPMVQLHFGGGTPNFLDIGQMSELMDSLGRHFSLTRAPTREFGIEIDPRFADADYVRALGPLGFNRMSVGCQDFDPAVQAAVNRIQSVEETRAVIEAAREADFRSVNLDLIYGLPLQTVDSFARTLDKVIALRPDRIAAYSYAHMPELFKAQRQIDAAQLPDAATRLALFARTLETLTAAGYVYIGMDHFALPFDELSRAQREGALQRNFQGYSTHGDCDIIALGMSAISRIGDSYSQNAKDLVGYYAALDAGCLPVMRGLTLDQDDLIRRALIAELMCHGRIDFASFGAAWRIDFPVYFADELDHLRQLAADGLVDIRPDALVVTSRGRLLVRIIAMCFDAYLGREAQTARYSRAI